VCVFLYWVRPLVMILTFAASVFRVGVHSIGCALLAPHQTLTSVPEREVKKKFPCGVFWVCALRAPHQTLASVLWGGENAVPTPPPINPWLFDSWSLWFTVEKTPHKRFVNIKLFFFFRSRVEKFFFWPTKAKTCLILWNFTAYFEKLDKQIATSKQKV